MSVPDWPLEPGSESCRRIEQGWRIKDFPLSEGEVEASRAISLKRIADALELLGRKPTGGLDAEDRYNLERAAGRAR